MSHWDIQFKSILENNGILLRLYKRYKDDINLILKIAQDNARNRAELEEITPKKIMELADSIHKSIKVTGEIPSKYEDKRLPIF